MAEPKHADESSWAGGAVHTVDHEPDCLPAVQVSYSRQPEVTCSMAAARPRQTPSMAEEVAAAPGLGFAPLSVAAAGTAGAAVYGAVCFH